MKKLFAISLAIIATLAIFFYLRQEPHAAFEPPESALTEASGIGTGKSASAYTEISPREDCSNECSSFKEDAEKYTYCRAVCGFTSEEGVAKPPTSADPGLSNDYTLREDAIRERNIRKCTLIIDTNLRATCQVRVTEDLLE
jgi:hypothetical protein